MNNEAAYQILKNGITPRDESIDQQKRYKRNKSIRIAIVCIVSIIVISSILYTFLLHPIDRLKIKLFFNDSYVITLNSTYDGVVSQIQVDGNVIFYNGNYYEITDYCVYIYTKSENGNWKKNLYISNLNNNDKNKLLGEALLDKNNYDRELIPCKPMKYNGTDVNKFGLLHSSIKIENVRLKYFSGKCTISMMLINEDAIYNSHHYATIEIGHFGWVHLKLPQV